MSDKKKAITIYFTQDEDVYQKLQNMNKFVRAEFIRTAIKNMLDNNTSLFFTNAQQTSIGKKIEEDKRIDIPDKKEISENRETKVLDIEENNNPFGI